MNYKYLKVLFISIVLIGNHACNASLLRALDKTDQVLPLELKKYSIAQGAVLWHTDWLYNFYRFGNFHPISFLDKQGRTCIGVDATKNDPLIRLMYVLFHQVPGGTSPLDFSTTDLLQTNDPLKIAKSSAHVVIGFEELKKVLDAFDSAVLSSQNFLKDIQYAQIHNKLFDTLKKALDNPSKNHHKIETTLQSFLSSKNKLWTDDSYKPLQDNLNLLLEATGQLNHSIKPYSDILKLSDSSNLKISAVNFIRLLCQALENCAPFEKSDCPEDIVYAIWLGFLYKTLCKLCDNDAQALRQAIGVYYSKLGKLLSKDIMLPTTIDLSASINPLEAQKKLTKLANSANPPLDDLLFYTFNSKSFPSLEGYKKVQISLGAFKNVIFADCMENSLANFLRIMSYDLRSQHYSLSTLEQNLNIKLSDVAQQRLKPFFDNPLSHEVWAKMVSNLVYIPYLDTNSFASGKKRYIRLDEDKDKNIFADGGYTVVNHDDIVYELRPSIRTVIMVLNYLLDLNLYEGPIVKEVLRSDFVEHYFPLLIKSINAKGIIEKDFEDNIDKTDSEGSIKSKFIVKNKLPGTSEPLTHVFNTIINHGTYDFIPFSKSTAFVINKEISQANFYARLILTHYSKEFKYPFFEVSFTMFGLPLYNADYSKKLLDHQRYPRDKVITYSKCLGYITLNLIQSHPETAIRINLLVDSRNPFMNNSSLIEMFLNYLQSQLFNSSLSYRDVAFYMRAFIREYSQNKDYNYSVLISRLIEHITTMSNENTPGLEAFTDVLVSYAKDCTDTIQAKIKIYQVVLNIAKNIPLQDNKAVPSGIIPLISSLPEFFMNNYQPSKKVWIKLLQDFAQVIQQYSFSYSDTYGIEDAQETIAQLLIWLHDNNLGFIFDKKFIETFYQEIYPAFSNSFDRSSLYTSQSNLLRNIKKIIEES